jgi:hypothetical protein
VTLVAYSRPFWPLFLHVLGAMLLFGFVLTALVTALAGKARATMTSLQLSLAAYAVMRGAAAWIYSKEGWSGHGDPTWLTLGMNIADGGLLVLLLAFSRRSGGCAVASRAPATRHWVHRHLHRAARRRLARDVRKMGLTKNLLQPRDFPRRRGIGSER